MYSVLWFVDGFGSQWPRPERGGRRFVPVMWHGIHVERALFFHAILLGFVVAKERGF